MRRSVLHRLAAGTAVAVCCLAVAGCWNPFAPEGGGDGPDTQIEYKVRTSPENVLHNLESAYKDKNLVRYLECLAEDFEFWLSPEDVNDPEDPLPESWGKTEEEDIHSEMFGQGEAAGADRIEITLTNVSTSYDEGEDPVDPSDDRWIYSEVPVLRVYVGDWIYLADADQEFHFQLDPNETGPNGEPLWEIIEWWDLPQDQPLGESFRGSAREVSVGRLKSMFSR